LLVVGAICVALFIAGVIALAVFLRSDTGQKVAGAIGKGVKMTMAAQDAPGAREITKAGCKQGLVMDAKESVELMRPFMPDAGEDTSRMAFRAMVACSVDFFGTPPACDAVKDAYLAAVPKPSDPFLVTVKRAGESHPRCMRVYDPEGGLLQDLDAGAH
jgi:hypothetical protein